MIFAREISDPLTSLVKKMDRATTELDSRGIDTFVIFCSSDAALEARLKTLIEKEQIQSSAVSISKNVPAGYKMPVDAEVTVLCFLKQSARAVFTYRKGELSAKDADRIVDTIDGLTEQPFPVGYVAPAYTPVNPITSNG